MLHLTPQLLRNSLITMRVDMLPDAHFLWGSVMYGYLFYDTAFSLVYWRTVGSLDFLLHHTVALGCCAFGLYCNRLAFFGMVIQVALPQPCSAVPNAPHLCPSLGIALIWLPAQCKGWILLLSCPGLCMWEVLQGCPAYPCQVQRGIHEPQHHSADTALLRCILRGQRRCCTS